jgi:hypothetical protein
VGPAATGDTGDVVRQIEAEIRRELTAYQSGHRDRFDDDFDWLRPRRRTPAAPPAPAPAAPPAPAPAAPPGAAGLRRRVPGRNLAETRPAEPQPRPMPESDAAAARSLIQQLEAGVARAQRAAAEDPSKGDRR